jgi:tetratricopeptide (TPR) repeat protein
MLKIAAVSAVFMLATLAGCNSTAQGHQHAAEMAYMAKDYDTAIKEYDIALTKAPKSVKLRFEKAQALYGKKDWAGARALFEEFLKMTDTDQHTWISERRDAVFYRDRCRQELGETVEQDPNKIPPPPMGE